VVVGADVLAIGALVKGGFAMTALCGVVALAGEAVAAFAACCCDFLIWAAGLDTWLAPVGLPRRTEHFWKWRLRMSLLEKVSLHKTHMYGRSPVSSDKSVKFSSHGKGITGLTPQHVPFQVFGMKIGLGAVWAGEFAICILLRHGVTLWRAVNTIGHDWWTSRGTGQNASSPL